LNQAIVNLDKLNVSTELVNFSDFWTIGSNKKITQERGSCDHKNSVNLWIKMHKEKN